MKYYGIAVWPFMFLKRIDRQSTINHEMIHFKQQLELLIIPFYILYGIFWIIKGYRKNPFEIEAFKYANTPHLRKPYGWLK
jgi:hypothetical protein